MHSRATSILAAGIWAMALPAQTAPPRIANLPQPSTVRPETGRNLRDFIKRYGQIGQGVQELGLGETRVCSIPLREVPVAKNVEQMPILRPRAEPDNMSRMYRMPSVKLPAPPCQEEKR